jgi:predicted short-subunit dehydrogenase-like oxidoreductase (DUF2520 family)
MAKSVTILGAGRVGRALGRRLRELGWSVRGVAARSERSAKKAVRFIGGGVALAGVSPRALDARVVLMTMPDDALAEAAQELALVGGGELRGKIILHTSGAMDSGVLEPLRLHGAKVASMHPMQSFSGVSVPSLEGRVFAIEGDAAAVRVAREMARSLGGVPVSIEAKMKPLYHASGAIAAGLALAVQESSVQLLMAAGLKRRESMRALLSLTRQVLDHFEKLGPGKAWTGPMSRGDYGVVAAHERALRDFEPEFLEAYQALNRLAARVLARNPEAALAALGKRTNSDEFTETVGAKGGKA